MAAGVGKRWRWGLHQGDVLYVYRFFSDGSTRLLALYSDALLRGERVVCGPVRSMRNAEAHIREEWQGVLVFSTMAQRIAGWDETFARFLATPQDDFSLRTGGLGVCQGRLWRLKDVKAPDNLCADVSAIQAGFPLERRSNARPLRFADGKQLYASAPQASRVTLDWGKEAYQTAFVYDEATGAYLREVNGVPFSSFASDVDRSEEGKVQLAFENVIVQHAAYITSEENEFWLMLDAFSGGEADAFVGGRHIQCRWAREGAEQRTVFYDETGQELALLRGKTYIALLPQEARMLVVP